MGVGSLHHVGCGDQAQVVRHGGWLLYRLSHPLPAANAFKWFLFCAAGRCCVLRSVRDETLEPVLGERSGEDEKQVE